MQRSGSRSFANFDSVEDVRNEHTVLGYAMSILLTVLQLSRKRRFLSTVQSQMRCGPNSRVGDGVSSNRRESLTGSSSD